MIKFFKMLFEEEQWPWTIAGIIIGIAGFFLTFYWGLGL